jgi:hypothetical protein
MNESTKPRMKNKVLANTSSKKVIIYNKDLNYLTESVTASILMQQLDYWIDWCEQEKSANRRQPGYEELYKFLEPCSNRKYKEGESWVEELGFTVTEFRSAFDKIGIRYKSKKEYSQHDDPFQNKFYCSYHDKIKGVTFYFRNHELVDKALDILVSEGLNRETITLLGIKNPNLRKSRKLIHVTLKSSFTEIKNPNPEYNTEITTEITPKITAKILSPNGEKILLDNSSLAEFEEKKQKTENPENSKVVFLRTTLVNALHPVFGSQSIWVDRLLQGTNTYNVKNKDAYLVKMVNDWLKKFPVSLILKGLSDVKQYIEFGKIDTYNSKYLFTSICLNNQIKVLDTGNSLVYTCKCTHSLMLIKNDYSIENCPACGMYIDYDDIAEAVN